MASRTDRTTGSVAGIDPAGSEQGSKKDAGLQRAVEKSVPDEEKLPGRAAENPISQKVKDASHERRPDPGKSTLKGDKKVD